MSEPAEVEPKGFAEVVWRAEDVQTLFDVTTEQAEEFLYNNEDDIQSVMIERGWDAIGDLGDLASLPRVKEESDGP